MDQLNKKDDIQKQFNGFNSTPLLWLNDTVLGLAQFETDNSEDQTFTGEINETPRLGKLVEQFLSHKLIKSDSCNELIENIQIQRDRITLGELDCIFKHIEQLIHLEVIYKFYLYDFSDGTSEIEKWIGPNRKDSLSQKLDKLIMKQLPRLYLPEAKEILLKYNINVDEIVQRVHFRAQLFVPFNNVKVVFDKINEKCVAGFYVHHSELEQFSENTFCLPRKLDWLTAPNADYKYTDLVVFKSNLESYMLDNRSPLCWMRISENEYKKMFVVWW